MSATSIDLSQIKTDALSAASTFRTLIGLGTGDTPTFKATTLSTGTITASTPALDISQTWNNNAVAFTGLKFNATDTASSASSLLMDLQVGGSSKFKVGKTGILTGPKNNGFLTTVADSTGSGSVSAPIYGAVGGPCLWIGDVLGISNGFLFSRGAVNPEIGVGSSTLVVGSAHSFAWASSSSVSANAPADLTLFRDAAGTLAQRNSTNAQTFRIYRTADGSPGSNYQRLALSSTTYSGASYQTILCESAGTGGDNINLVLSPKGTGAIVAQVPDGTATGGNARGQYAVDLQHALRGSADSVASGNYSCICGGEDSRATGIYSTVCAGRGNYATNEYTTIAGGRSGSASGQYATIPGGRSCVASGDYSISLGGYDNNSTAYCTLTAGYSALASRPFQRAFSAIPFATRGDAQDVKFILKKKTTDAVAATMLLGDDTTRLTIPSGKVFAFVAKISGIKSDGTAVAFYTRKGCIKNVGGTTSLVGSIETIGTDTEDNASTDVAITADDTNDAIQINVTGIAAETWRWVAVVEGVEIGYGS